MLNVADDATAVEDGDGEAKILPRFDGEELARHVAVVYGPGQHISVAAICPDTRDIRRRRSRPRTWTPSSPSPGRGRWVGARGTTSTSSPTRCGRTWAPGSPAGMAWRRSGRS